LKNQKVSSSGTPMYLPEMPGGNVGGGDHRRSQGIDQDYRLGKAAREVAASDRLRSFTS